MEDFGDMQTTSANTRIPYASTLQLEDDMIPAWANPNIPPWTTTTASATQMPLNVQAAIGSLVGGYPVRGEK